MSTAAELVAKVLADAGIKYVFGIGGDSVLALIDAIDRTPGINYIMVCHEQVGTAMADGYIRVSGQPAAVLAHMGPGICNLVIGLASAYRDSSPVIALTGVREQRKIGRDSWHEIDQLGILRPVTRWNARIPNADSAPRLMREAISWAFSGRQGPIQIELPKDVARMESELPAGDPVNVSAIQEASRTAPNPALVARACDLLLAARQPVILSGGGAVKSGAGEALLALGDLLAIPIATTNKGRGVIPEDHPLCLGPMGQYGTPFAGKQVSQADVVLGLGCRFSDVTTREWTLVSPGSKIIHVDIDPKELGRQFKEEVSMIGDVRLFLGAAIAEIKKRNGGRQDKGPIEKHPRISALVQEREAEREAFFRPSSSSVPGKPQLFIKEVSSVLKRDAIVALGSGLYSRFAGRLRIHEPRSYLKSLGLGAMGWAFPAAMGAKLAHPNRQVIALMGDADFMMVMQDIETVVRENIAVAVVIFNDKGYGSVRELQRRDFGGRVVGSDYNPPPFHEIARVMGATGIGITQPEEIGPALQKIFDSGKPGILQVSIDPHQR